MLRSRNLSDQGTDSCLHCMAKVQYILFHTNQGSEDADLTFFQPHASD